MSAATQRITVAVIGGGFSGAAVALHLANRFPRSRLRVVVFEPRARLGAGLAYDTDEPVHRINVPASRMSLYPDEPLDFSRWLNASQALASDLEAFAREGAPFPRRALFGQYVHESVARHIRTGAVEHWQTRAVDARREDGLWTISDENGRQLQAHAVVLAVSHPEPSLPASLKALAGHEGLVEDATKADALDRVAEDARVLIVGNGLTAADVIAALKRRGHKGTILSISRRGLRSRGHPTTEETFEADFTMPPPKSASALLKRVRTAVLEANAEGLTWHPVLDAVRAQGQDIWAALPLSERRRIARHIRPFWDVHRFRIAPQVETVLDQAIREGSLTVKAASLQTARAEGNAIRVTLRERRHVREIEADFDTVIVTTGPAHGGILQSQPLLANLAASGTLALCPTGLGILCDRQSRAISKDGKAEETLLIAGPLARGTFGELMGLPQVSEHALAIAGEVGALVEVELANIKSRQTG